MHDRLCLQGAQLKIQQEMEDKLRTVELGALVDQIREEEAEKKRARIGKENDEPWVSVPEHDERTICIDVRASTNGEYNDGVKNALNELHKRGRIAKLFTSFHGAHKLSKQQGGGMVVDYKPPQKPEEPDPHRYTIVMVYGEDDYKLRREDVQEQCGWWVELDDETGGVDDYPPVWICGEYLNGNPIHPMVGEHLANLDDPRNPVNPAKRKANIRNCRDQALMAGEDYLEFHDKANKYFARLASLKCDQEYEFMYEAKYLYKHAVEP